MKILVIKSSSLGDIIHAYDLIVYLKKKIASLHLEWVVESSCAPLVERHPYVNRVHLIESKKWPRSYFTETSSYSNEEFDLVFDLQGNCKSALLLARSHAKKKIGFGWKTVPEWPNLFFTTKRFNPPRGQNIRQDYLFLAQSHFQDFSPLQERGPLLVLSEEEREQLAHLPKGGVIVSANSRWPNKEVSEEALIASVKKEERVFLLWRGEKEKRKAEQLQLRFGTRAALLPELSLPLLQHVLSRADRVVSVDSLVLHLAATTSVPTTSFFGPSRASKYGPLGDHHQIYEGKCPYGQSFEKRCPYLRTCLRPRCILEHHQVSVQEE